jgi:hypothetical protein
LNIAAHLVKARGVEPMKGLLMVGLAIGSPK